MTATKITDAVFFYFFAASSAGLSPR